MSNSTLDLARTEPDPEIQALIRASAGLNLALDYLPGAVTFDPIAEKPDSELASSIVWFDAYVSNVDRTPRNPNILVWHRRLWLIDHGSALYFHHAWNNPLERCHDPCPQVKDHVLLLQAGSLPEIHPTMLVRITPEVIERVVELIPDSWLVNDTLLGGSQQQRNVYTEYLVRRLEPPESFLEEAIRARSLHL